MAPSESNQAIYIISVAAELAGVHPQTLRVYERKGLVNPQRTEGNTRRYSQSDIELLRRIQELTNEGINLAGVLKVLELEKDMNRLRARLARTSQELELTRSGVEELMNAQSRMSMVPLKDVRRVRRAMKADQIEQAGVRRTFSAPPASVDE